MKLSSLLLVDLIGSVTVAACAGVGIWQGWLTADSASQRIEDLTAETAELEANLNKMQVTLEARQAAFRDQQATLGEHDLLPETTPIERDLSMLSELAGQNGLELSESIPLGSRRYPGVLEVRYRLRTSGRFLDYVGFLRDFQHSSSWADITFVKLTSTNARIPGEKSGELTISLYSAIDDQEEKTIDSAS